MSAEALHGNSLLFDSNRGVILRGEIRLMTDGKGRSEIHVANDQTGLTEHLVFTTGSLWIPVMQLIQVIQDAHAVVDVDVQVVDGTDGECGDCGGLGEYEDEEGNWRTCRHCGGRV